MMNLTILARERDVLEQMAFNMVSSRVDGSGEKTVKLQGPQGQPLTVTVEPVSQTDPPVFTAEDMRDVQIDTNLSDRQVLIVLSKMRWRYGCKTIEGYMRDELVKRKQLFVDYFTAEWVAFGDKDKSPVEKTLVVVARYK